MRVSSIALLVMMSLTGCTWGGDEPLPPGPRDPACPQIEDDRASHFLPLAPFFESDELEAAELFLDLVWDTLTGTSEGGRDARSTEKGWISLSHWPASGLSYHRMRDGSNATWLGSDPDQVEANATAILTELGLLPGMLAPWQVWEETIFDTHATYTRGRIPPQTWEGLQFRHANAASLQVGLNSGDGFAIWPVYELNVSAFPVDKAKATTTANAHYACNSLVDEQLQGRPPPSEGPWTLQAFNGTVAYVFQYGASPGFYWEIGVDVASGVVLYSGRYGGV